jgi:hypothetical protein
MRADRVLLGKVADVFRITGRGCVLVPEFAEPEWRIRVGDQILLKTSEGHETRTKILGISHLKPLQSWKRLPPGLLLPPDVKLDDVRAGTEIWLLPEQASPVPRG